LELTAVAFPAAKAVALPAGKNAQQNRFPEYSASSGLSRNPIETRSNRLFPQLPNITSSSQTGRFETQRAAPLNIVISQTQFELIALSRVTNLDWIVSARARHSCGSATSRSCMNIVVAIDPSVGHCGTLSRDADC